LSFLSFHYFLATKQSSATACATLTPSAMPSSAILMGVFGKRLFEQSEFPIAAHKDEQRREQMAGVAFFLDTFSWLNKKKYLDCRSRPTNQLVNTYATLQLQPP
jgi:hypothetical protein